MLLYSIRLPWNRVIGIAIGLAVSSIVGLTKSASIDPPVIDFVPPKTTPGKAPVAPTYKYDVPEGLNTPIEWQLEDTFQSGSRCGPNSLFLLLRFENIDVTYEQVLATVPLSEAGCTLDDLHNAAQQFGLATEARKLTPEEVVIAPKPLIVHFNALASGGQKTRANRNHFSIVTSASLEDGSVAGIDSVNLMPTRYSANGFARNFSGYCLVLRRSSRSWILTTKGLAAIGLFLVILAANVFIAFSGKSRAA
jgi:hypothetical protein